MSTINTISQLKAAYPYQFTKKTYELSLPHGWFSIFVKLCGDVDALLIAQGKGNQRAQWTQVKEKFGTGRFHIKANAAVLPSIVKLTIAAGNETCDVCICCGRPGSEDNFNHYILTLCDQHKADRHAGLQLKIWIESDDEPVLAEAG
jgi:hypothetical protein